MPNIYSRASAKNDVPHDLCIGWLFQVCFGAGVEWKLAKADVLFGSFIR